MYLKTKQHKLPAYTTHLPYLPQEFAGLQRRWKFLLGCLAIPLFFCLCSCCWLAIYVVFPPSPTDIVILGMDARPGQGYLTRTDTFIIFNITPAERKATMLSIPRDVFIWVPDYGEQRINTINVLGEQEKPGGGPDLVAASLEESFGIQADRYIRLDFNAFVEIIDAVGGIDIDVPKLIIDYEYPTMDGGVTTVQFDPGKEHMKGERALQYARTRHQDDDYQRADRQQQVIDALVKRLASPVGMIHLPQVLRVISSNTDTDLSAWDMLRLGPAFLMSWPTKEDRVLQREDLIGMAAGYWRPDYDNLQEWISDHFD